jgi:uncharacterized membrane protein HdeD (DUF308 family)
MSVQLKEDWKTVATRAWSMWLMGASFVLSGLEVVIQVLVAFTITPPFVPPGLFAILAGVVTVLAMGARLLVQSDVQ